MKCSESTIRKMSLLCATIILFVFFQHSYTLTESGHNVSLYIVSLALFGLSYLSISLLLQKIYDINQNSIKNIIHIILILLVLVSIGFSVVWAIKYYHLEAEPFTGSNAIFLRHTIDGRIYATVLVGFSAMLVTFISQSVNKNILGRAIATIIVGLGQAAFLYTPNFIYDTQGGPFHIDAYVVSIINCLHGVPYSEMNTSIYGKYGIFYVIPVKIIKLFGVNEWIAVTIAICLVGFITYLFQGYILSKLVDNDLLYIMGLLALAFPSFQLYSGVYYQVLPHRVLIPTVIIFGCLKYIESTSKKRSIGLVMWLLCALAILWNIETGMVSTIVWSFTYGYKELIDNQKIWKILVKCVGFFCISFISGFIIFNLYNLIVGGDFQSIKRYLYPLLSEKSLSLVQKSLDPPWGLYFGLIVLFAAPVCYYLMRLIRKNIDEKQLLIVIISIMGLGLMTYYMNRPVLTNVTIVVFEVVCVGSYVMNGLTREKTGLHDFAANGVFYFVCATIIVAMSFASVFSVVDNYNLVKINGQDSVRIAEYSRRMNVIIPDDTFAYGYFVEPLYSYMNRDNVLYMEDWEDLEAWDEVNVDSYIAQELEKSQPRYLLTGIRNEVYVPNEYTEIFDSHIEIGSGVEYKLYYKGEIRGTYYLMRNLLVASSVYKNLDNLIVQSEKIDSDDKVLAEYWEALTETTIFNEEMTTDEFVIKLFLNSLNRNPNDEEYAHFFKLIEEQNYSKEMVLKEFLSNEQYQNDAIDLNYNIMDFYN